MTEGLYLYCIADTDEVSKLGDIGLYDSTVQTINFKDIGAVVSPIPFKEVSPNVPEISCHQRVVEASRERWTTLPVRFGTMFKNSTGLKEYLTKSYGELKPQIAKLKNKDEYGVKAIFDDSDLSKLKLQVDENPEIKKIKKEIANSSEGTAYFLKLRMDDALKNEILKKIDEISGDIHKQLAKVAAKNCILRSDLSQIIMNSSYLVDRNEKEKFDSQLNQIKEKYEKQGVMIHVSGPWAPYSFC